jgi:glutaredoxin
LKVTLYTKAECGLCAEAEEALLRVQKLIQFEAEFVYIEDDDELYERYSQRVPVVVVDGREVASAPVDEAGLQAVLSAV